jgi:nucleotide-binding universal stress UspA family protein
MSSIRHILAGTDLSEASANAIERGYLLAEENHARYSVIYALGLDPLTTLREIMGQNSESLTERVTSAGQKRLEASLADLNKANRVQAEAIVMQGRVGPALSAFIDEHECDLLVLGVHGSGVLQRLIVGSTTSRALRQSKIPVLVIKNEANQTYQRVLIAVDFSPLSKTLVHMCRVIAPHADITLLHVCSDAMEAQMRYASVNDSVVAQYRANSERQAKIKLTQLAQECELGADQYDGVITHGIPVREVMRFEEEFQPDLLMMGKHGTHTTEELLLGSVTKRAVEMTHADVFVMVDKRQAAVD